MRPVARLILTVHHSRLGAAQLLAAIVALGIALAGAAALACPFCTVESRTLSEEIDAAQAVVMAKLVADAQPAQQATGVDGEPDTVDPNSGEATFRIIDVIRGDDRVKSGDQIKVVYFGEGERDKTFLISGIGVENNQLEWTTPLPLSDTAIEYIRKLPDPTVTGLPRLQFFQEYLENDDPLLAQDAYDEFARAPYSVVHELKGHMFHDRLVKWIQSPDVNPSRRRLYLTMLGVCGGKDDLPMLEEMIESDYSTKKPYVEQLVAVGQALGGPIGITAWNEMLDLEERQKKLGLDAAVACFLTLRGPDGLDLIDERFLKNPKVEYTHAYMTIMAMRFHGEESDVIPKPRLLASMRLLLDNPEFADQVIPDLSRWQDWSVLDRLVAMYKNGNEKSYVRQPIVTYLTVASEQPGEVGARAKAALADLEKLDPEGVKRARSLMAFGFLARAREAKPDAPGAQRPEADDKTAEAPDGFAAGAADADEEEADPSGIPDPSDFGDSAVAKHPSEFEESAESDAEEATSAANEQAATPVEQSGTHPEPNSSLAETDVLQEVEPAPTMVYSRPVVIGVPLASVVVLATVYWLILRWGVM